MGNWNTLVGCAALVGAACAAHGEVKVEKIAYLGQPNCYKLSNGTAEAVVTTDVGPRVIRYALVGGSNMLAELPDMVIKTAWGDWKPYGGHRLWHAPEVKPRSYSPDNEPVTVQMQGTNGIQLTQAVEPKTGIVKQMVVTLDETGSGLTVAHKLTNMSPFAIEAAPWALTIMSGGGVAILPNEPYKSHDDYVAAARPMVMWHYTDLSDPRWALGRKYIRLRSDPALDTPQKIGCMNKQGWAGYHLAKTLFIKRFPYTEGLVYPDYGCNCETFTKGSFMEVESVGAVTRMEPGGSADHTERWYLFGAVNLGATEAELDAAITPLIGKATP